MDNPDPLLPPPIDPKSRETIDDRQTKEKTDLIEQLKLTPIVQVACKKSYISRSTYYRWRQEDPDFVARADDALNEGTVLMNDFAESKLLEQVGNGKIAAIIFWLKHHHLKYAPKPIISLSPDKNGKHPEKLVISWEDGEQIQ